MRNFVKHDLANFDSFPAVLVHYFLQVNMHFVTYFEIYNINLAGFYEYFANFVLEILIS